MTQPTRQCLQAVGDFKTFALELRSRLPHDIRPRLGSLDYLLETFGEVQTLPTIMDEREDRMTLLKAQTALTHARILVEHLFDILPGIIDEWMELAKKDRDLPPMALRDSAGPYAISAPNTSNANIAPIARSSSCAWETYPLLPIECPFTSHSSESDVARLAEFRENLAFIAKSQEACHCTIY